MKKIMLTGNPLSTNHLYKRRSSYGMYLVAEGVTLKESYQYEAKSQWQEKPLKGKLKIKVCLFFGDKRKRDIDNYNKLSMDALNGIVWEDDQQIYQMLIKKEYDKDNPRIEIQVEEI